MFFPVPGGPSQATLADVNGDSNLDVLVASAVSDTLSILLGNDDGTLQTPRQFPIGAFVTPPADVTARLPTLGRDVAVADFNRDGVPDFVTTNFASADVSLLLGNGDGTAQPQRRFNATPAPFDLDVGDVNRDGLPDVVVIETGLGTRDAVIASLISRGNGTFSLQKTSTIPVKVNNDGTVRIADFNEDGNPDLAVSGDGVSYKASILFGDGTGEFTYCGEACDVPAGHLTIALAVDDVNGDGHQDIVTVGFEAGDGHVNLGRGDGTFQPAIPFFGGQAPAAVEIVDIGSESILPGDVLGPPDGRPDLVVAYSGVKTGPARVAPGPEVAVHFGLVDAQGKFSGFGPRISLTDAGVSAPLDVDIGDLNNDGALDVVVVDLGGILVIYGQPPRNDTLGTAHDLAVDVPNNTRATARDLGTVVHLVEPTRTIVPGYEDAWFKLTVPSEAVAGAGDEVIDFSALFERVEGAGLAMEVLDAGGTVLASGERFRLRAAQGEALTLHVFGVEADDGTHGAGAYTLVINVLPQVVSVESQALLPGIGDQPGGPTASIVITFQGDRLDPATAEDVSHYAVTFLGADGQRGGGDDQVVPISCGIPESQCIVYDPGANIQITSGTTFPTAVRQTVTLLFEDPLPAGSYQIELSPQIQSAPFNENEPDLLAGGESFSDHPVVTLQDGQILEGSHVEATDLVLEAGTLGDFREWESGTAFLTQLDNDLSALLDAILTEHGDDPNITTLLNDQVLARFNPALGEFGARVQPVLVLWLDPGDVQLADPKGDQIIYDSATGTLEQQIQEAFVEVLNSIQVIVLTAQADTNSLNTSRSLLSANVPTSDVGSYVLMVDNIPPTARGGFILFGLDGNQVISLTDDLRAGVREFHLFG